MSTEIELTMSESRFNELFGDAIESLERWQLRDALNLFAEYVARKTDVRTKAERRKKRKPRQLPEELRLKRARKRISQKERDRWSTYEAYLQSNEWSGLRTRILNRDKLRCVACGNNASCVHHRSYDKETMAGHRLHKLVSLCGECHQHVHFIGEEKQSMELTDIRLLELIVKHERQDAMPPKMAKECKMELWNVVHGVVPLV